MTARNLELVCDKVTVHYTDMKSASVAFGRALNKPFTYVALREVTLQGTNIIAQLVRQQEQFPGRYSPCVVCGVNHAAEDHHGYETTGNRLLMQHDHDNHGQCHPSADCRKEGGNECE